MRFLGFVVFVLFVTKVAMAQGDLEEMSYHELDSMRQVYYDIGEYDKSIVYIEHAMNRAKVEYGEKDSVYAITAGNLGTYYGYIGEYEKGVFFCLKSVELIKTIFGKNSAEYTGISGELAGIYGAIGRYKEAESLFQEALEIDKSLFGAKSEAYATSAHNLATLYSQIGLYEKSEPLFLITLAIDKKTIGEDHPDYAWSLNNLAALYYGMGKYEQAELFLLETLKLQKKNLGEKHPSYGSTLSNLAGLYKRMGKYEEAGSMFLQSIDIQDATTGVEHPNYGKTLLNLAGVYNSENKLIEAQKFYLEALSNMEKTLGKEHSTYATGLSQLASLHKKMGNYEQAEQLYLDTKEIWKKSFGEKSADYATALNNLATIYKYMGKYELSEKLYLQAKEIRQAILGEGHVDYTSNLSNLGSLYLEWNNLDTAFAYTMASLASNSKQFNHLFVDWFEPNSEREKYAPLSCCPKRPARDFLKISELDYYGPLEASTSLALLLKVTKAQSKVLEDVEQIEKLEQYFNISKAAMQMTENIRNDFAGKQNKLRLLKENTTFVAHGIDAALTINTPEVFAEAFSFSEQNKSVLLADAIKGNRARILGDLPDSLALQEMTLQEEKEELTKYELQAKTEAEKAEIVAVRNELNFTIDSFLNSLKDKYPKYHALKYENTRVKLEEVQALLDKETILIEYFVTDTKTYVFVVSKEDLEIHPIEVDLKTLQKKVGIMRKSLSDYKLIIDKKIKAHKLYTESAYWFYEKLLAVVLENKTQKKLIIVSDGPLGHLPFEAFLSQPAEQGEVNYGDLDYLLNDYTVSYNYSASLWKENMSSKPSSNNKMLACAGTYPSEDKWKEGGMDSLLSELRTPYIYNLRKKMIPLLEAQNEVTALGTIFEGDFLSSNAANEAFFKKNADQYGIIHLAMHGVLHPRVPMLSSLAFTENNDSIEDNFLQAYEISRLKLNANLVVLSACETGSGKFEQGEGVISLARSFMYAGTPSLVVSLWSVNDYSTAIIMKAFYQNLSKGTPKDVALRQAKLDYMNQSDGILMHPAFWSPFIQLGDSRPIALTRKGGGILPWLVGGGLLLLGIVGLLWRRKNMMT